MNDAFRQDLASRIKELQDTGFYKDERVITSPQRAHIAANGTEVINLCANNYLGLSDHPALVTAARRSLDERGYGLSSVRFICGTQDTHKQLEAALSDLLKTDDTILYSSCFDANGGLFETLLGPEDAVISDALNHASIIDGIRLCKARRYRYENNDLKDLEAKLQEAQGARYRLIATDGVFSMDGIIANLKGICDLAERYDAMVMVDDSHAVGFLGAHGAGSIEYCDVMGRVDIITGTLGKALGGASGGYTSGRQEIITWLRQRSRPYLFSNTLAPMIAGGSLAALKLIKEDPQLRTTLQDNTKYFASQMSALGFKLAGKDHPIVPVMLGDSQLAKTMADKLLAEGIYVIGFSFPVVPKGAARIRTQISAAHSREDLDRAIAAFAKVGRELGVIA